MSMHLTILLSFCLELKIWKYNRKVEKRSLVQLECSYILLFVCLITTLLHFARYLFLFLLVLPYFPLYRANLIPIAAAGIAYRGVEIIQLVPS